MFANDTVLLAESEEDLKCNVEKLHEAMKRHRLKVNWSKSNTMVFSRVPTECNIEIDGERVTVFLHLQYNMHVNTCRCMCMVCYINCMFVLLYMHKIICLVCVPVECLLV